MEIGMKKQYKVRNHKKTEHIFRNLSYIGDYLDSLESYAERTLFVWKENGEPKELTYGDFREMVIRFSKALVSLYGEQAKRSIAVIGETSPYWLASYLAILASGNVAVPMDKELDPAEISKFFDFADVAAVVYSPTFNDVFKEMSVDHKTLRTLIPMDPAAEETENTVPFARMIQMGIESERDFIPDSDRERPAELLFTSGTTGSSKCVMLCQRNIFSAVTTACASTDFCSDDVLVSVLPLHHTYELACMIAATNYGIKICINDSLRNALKNFKEYQPTGLVLVPLFVSTMYKKILSEAKRSGKDKVLGVATKVAHALSFVGIDISEHVFKDVRAAFGGRLRKIICGGAALNPEMIQAFESFGISIYEGYGITECAPLVAVTPYYKRKCGSVGPAVPCCEVRIDGTEENEYGYVYGEIQVKGDNVMLGYMNNDEANEAVFTEDGWFRTGDVGYLDNDGYIYITGRMKSVIVLENGKNVFPEEIEEYLEGIETIAESVVVGREEDGAVKLVAVVVPAYQKYPDMSENDIRTDIQQAITALNKRLPSFKQIHKIEFRKTEFEKTTTKKIKRFLVN